MGRTSHAAWVALLACGLSALTVTARGSQLAAAPRVPELHGASNKGRVLASLDTLLKRHAETGVRSRRRMFGSKVKKAKDKAIGKVTHAVVAAVAPNKLPPKHSHHFHACPKLDSGTAGTKVFAKDITHNLDVLWPRITRISQPGSSNSKHKVYTLNNLLPCNRMMDAFDTISSKPNPTAAEYASICDDGKAALQGYTNAPGACDGSAIASLYVNPATGKKYAPTTRITAESCANRCNQAPRCSGFTYSPPAGSYIGACAWRTKQKAASSGNHTTTKKCYRRGASSLAPWRFGAKFVCGTRKPLEAILRGCVDPCMLGKEVPQMQGNFPKINAWEALADPSQAIKNLGPPPPPGPPLPKCCRVPQVIEARFPCCAEHMGHKTTCCGAPYKLVKAKVQCRSNHTSLGKHRTVQACAAACKASAGCRFFIAGTGKANTGACYRERTASEACSEGWKPDKFDFYRSTASRRQLFAVDPTGGGGRRAQGVSVAVSVSVERTSAAQSTYQILMNCLKTSPAAACVGNSTVGSGH